MTTSSETAHQSIRGAALVAGVALLAIAVLAGLGNFGVVENLVTAGDAEKTAQDIHDSAGLFRLGVVGLLLAAVLDVIVAWALMVFFRPVHDGVSTLAGWLRAVYAGVYVVAIAQLAGALPLTGGTEFPGAYTAPQLHAEALLKINAFHDIWDAGLALFGLHLLLLGYLAYRSASVPTLVGVLLAIAGLGYLLDSLGVFLVPDYPVRIAAFTFVGEVVLLIWLLVKGRTLAATDLPAGPRRS